MQAGALLASAQMVLFQLAGNAKVPLHAEHAQAAQISI